MPLPRSIALFNKRFTNPFFVRVLHRTPGFTVVEHIGRRTGVSYRTPVYVFPDGDGGLLVSLTYGPTADWAQNVLAGKAVVLRNGAPPLSVQTGTVVGREIAWPHLPRLVRAWMRILTVHDFMHLQTAQRR